MSVPIVTQRRADTISLGLFLIGLGSLMYINSFWPWILLLIGVSLVTRQHLRGRRYDMAITSFVFGGLFLFYFSEIDWAELMPVLLVTGGIYLIFREYLVTKKRFGKEKVEDERENIEEQTKTK